MGANETRVDVAGLAVQITPEFAVRSRLGHPNVAIYDGGLLEWCADPALPLELGDV